MRKEKTIDRFLSHLGTCKVKTKSRWNRYAFNTESAVSYFSNLSIRDKKLVVKNDLWNKYPSYTCSISNPNIFGPLIEQMVRYISDSNKEDFDIILKNSVGLFACAALDSSYGKERVKAAKRLSKAKDVRVRRRCANIVPARYLTNMSNDRSESVRSIVIKRVGIDNCSDRFLGDKSGWIKSHAILHCDISSFDYKDILEANIEELSKINDEWRGWSKRRIVNNILRKIPIEELLYYMNTVNFSSGTEEIINRRLSGYKQDTGNQL